MCIKGRVDTAFTLKIGARRCEKVRQKTRTPHRFNCGVIDWRIRRFCLKCSVRERGGGQGGGGGGQEQQCSLLPCSKGHFDV